MVFDLQGYCKIWNVHLEQWKVRAPSCWGYIGGWCPTQLCGGYNIQHETRIPTKLAGSTSIMRSRSCFLFLSTCSFMDPMTDLWKVVHLPTLVILTPQRPGVILRTKNTSAKNRFKSFHWRVQLWSFGYILPTFCWRWYTISYMDPINVYIYTHPKINACRPWKGTMN